MPVVIFKGPRLSLTLSQTDVFAKAASFLCERKVTRGAPKKFRGDSTRLPPCLEHQRTASIKKKERTM